MTFPPASTLLAPAELVCAAWIASIPGFTADSVDPVLPEDDSTWVRHGAVTMMVVGGDEHPYIAVSRTVLQVVTWTCNPGSNRPEWFKSKQMASQIRMATLDRLNMHRPLQVEHGGDVYPGAIVHQAAILATARRTYGEKSDYAGHMFDLMLQWVQPGLVTR